MSFFSNSVKVVTTATPNFTVESYEGPNVGQYGWTKADTGHYNQLIQYVEECRSILEQIKEIQGGLPLILEYINEIRKTHEDIMEAQKEIDASLVIFDANYKDFMEKYVEFTKTYVAFQNQYVDFLNRGQAIVDSANDAATRSSRSADQSQAYSVESQKYSEASQSYSTESLGFAHQSEEFYKKSEELYEELRKGQVYRGSWNPHTAAWPDNGGTNSVWDVVLNDDEIDFTWNGIKWSWGDRLIYLKDTNEYQQLSSGKGVVSVNGKSGAVLLGAVDVGALPVTGGSVNGTVQIQSTHSEPIAIYAPKSGTKDVRLRGYDSSNNPNWYVGTIGGNLELYSNDKGCGLSINNNTAEGLLFRGKKVYNESFNPTAANVGARPDTWTPSASEVGALPLSGGAVEGLVTVNNGLVVNHAAGSHKQLVFTNDQTAMFGAFSRRFVNYLDQNNMDAWAWRVTQEGTGVRDIMTLNKNGALELTTIGSPFILPGGSLSCQQTNILSLNSNKYSFVTSPQDTHLCFNNYYDGAWKKYENARESYHFVLKAGGPQIVYSPAGNANPLVSYWKVYHEGNKPTAEDVGALPLSGGSVTGNLNIGSNHRFETDSTISTYNSKNPNGWRLYMGGTGGAGEVLTVNNTSGVISAKKKFQADNQILTKAPNVTITGLSGLTGGEDGAPILCRNVQTPRAATTYVEMLHGSSQVSEVGYKGHLSIGAKRSDQPNWGAAYIAYGGSDGYPTKEWLFHSTSGNFESPGNIYAPKHIVSGRGGMANTAPNDQGLQDSSMRVFSDKNLFIDAVDGIYLGSNFGHSGSYGWHKKDNSKASGYIRVTADPTQLSAVYSKAGVTNPNESTYKIYHEGNQPTTLNTLTLENPYKTLIVGKTGGANVDTNGWPNATNSDSNNYNHRARSQWCVGNNGLYVIGDGGTNARRWGIQSGHESAAYATSYGKLELNPYGGDVLVNGGKVYTQTFKPSPADLNAVAKTGDTMTGGLTINYGMDGVQHLVFNNTLNAMMGTYQQRFVSYLDQDNMTAWAWRATSNGLGVADKMILTKAGDLAVAGNLSTATGTFGNKVQSNDYWSRSSNRRMIATEAESGAGIYWGNNAQWSRFYCKDGTFQVSDGTNIWKVYHQGAKPTASDVGALPLTGGSLTGDFGTTGSVFAQGQLKTNSALTLVNNVRTLQLHAEDTAGGICYFNLNDSAVRPIEFFDEGFIRVNPQQQKGVDRIRAGRSDIHNQFHSEGIAAFTYGINNGDNFAINQSNGSFTWTRTLMTINAVSGDMQLSHAGYANNGFHTGSDLRFKEKVKPLSRLGGSWLDKVCSLGASSYVYKDKPEAPRLGFIAQEVQEVIPDAVSVQKVTHPDAVDTADLVERMFLDPMAIIAAQNEAIKELVEKFNALEDRLKVLEGLS